jgi:hypothetical protein
VLHEPAAAASVSTRGCSGCSLAMDGQRWHLATADAESDPVSQEVAQRHVVARMGKDLLLIQVQGGPHEHHRTRCGMGFRGQGLTSRLQHAPKGICLQPCPAWGSALESTSPAFSRRTSSAWSLPSMMKHTGVPLTLSTSLSGSAARFLAHLYGPYEAAGHFLGPSESSPARISCHRMGEHAEKAVSTTRVYLSRGRVRSRSVASGSGAPPGSWMRRLGGWAAAAAPSSHARQLSQGQRALCSQDSH